MKLAGGQPKIVANNYILPMTILTNRESVKRRKIQAIIRDAEKLVANYFTTGKECPRSTYERYLRLIDPERICRRLYLDMDDYLKITSDNVIIVDTEKTLSPIQRKVKMSGIKVSARRYTPRNIEFFKIPRTPTETLLYRRIAAFLKRGVNPQPFTPQEVINKFGPTPKCALSGRTISYANGKTYHFDHIIPVKRGGSATLNNLQLISPTVNGIKCAMTDSEYIKLCREVVAYQDSLTART